MNRIVLDEILQIWEFVAGNNWEQSGRFIPSQFANQRACGRTSAILIMQILRSVLLKSDVSQYSFICTTIHSAIFSKGVLSSFSAVYESSENNSKFIKDKRMRYSNRIWYLTGSHAYMPLAERYPCFYEDYWSHKKIRLTDCANTPPKIYAILEEIYARFMQSFFLYWIYAILSDISSSSIFFLNEGIILIEYYQ